jgi:hypothetical protein
MAHASIWSSALWQQDNMHVAPKKSDNCGEWGVECSMRWQATAPLVGVGELLPSSPGVCPLLAP